MQQFKSLFLAFAIAGSATGCATSQTYEPLDPLEPVNRQIFSFNSYADSLLVRPAAKAYSEVMPAFARNGIRNVLSNLFYPTVVVNDLLQGKWRQAGLDAGRFLTNSTAGFVGFFDVATRAGMPEHDEDFGQTLAVWGVGNGWYLVIPFLGPSTNRDLSGDIVDGLTGLPEWADIEFEQRIVFYSLAILDKRAQLLGTDKIIYNQFDPYAFTRTAYLDRRRNKVYDGVPPPEEFDFGE